MARIPTTRQTAAAGTALVGVAVAASLAVWSSLPAEMAIHWDAGGTADDTAPRAVGALLLPAIALAVFAMLLFVPRFDPLGENVEQFRPQYNGFVLLMTGFLCGVHGAVLATNLGHDVPMATAVVGFAGVLFVYTGSLLRVAEPNWFVGIRTPWTLSSEAVWERVHEVGSVLFAAVGVLTIVASVVGVTVGPAWLGTAVLTGGAVLVALVSVAHSYYLYEKLDRPGDRPASN